MKKQSETLATLSKGHQVGLDQLAQLPEFVENLNDGKFDPALRTIDGLLAFIEGELRGHFRLEEEALFPALAKPLKGPGPLLVDGEEPEICAALFCDSSCRIVGPLAIYLREHVMIWEVVDRLRAVRAKLDPANVDEQVRRRLEATAVEFEWRLGSHITKEEEALLPKAREVLGNSAIIRLDTAARDLAG